MIKNFKLSPFYFIATCALLLGRSVEFIKGDSPIRGFAWSHDYVYPTMSLLEKITFLSWTKIPWWEDWFVNILENWQAGLYLVTLVMICALHAPNRFLKWGIYASVVSLFFLLVVCATMEKHMTPAMWIEHLAQAFCPLLLWWDLNGKIKRETQIFWGKVIIALTFVGHGLFAVGFYPIPRSFISMTQSLFPAMFTADVEKFLMVAGVLDFVVAIGIFAPRKWSQYFMAYMVFWGFVTAFMRLYYFFAPSTFWSSLLMGVPVTIYRFPHFLVPLHLFFKQRLSKKAQKLPDSDKLAA